MVMAHLIRVRCAHKYDRPFFWHFPATTRVHLAEEELDEDRKGPQEGIVHILIHDGDLFAVRIHLFGHFGGWSRGANSRKRTAMELMYG